MKRFSAATQRSALERSPGFLAREHLYKDHRDGSGCPGAACRLPLPLLAIESIRRVGQQFIVGGIVEAALRRHLAR